MIFFALISVLKAESGCSVPCGGGLKVCFFMKKRIYFENYFKVKNGENIPCNEDSCFLYETGNIFSFDNQMNNPKFGYNF